MDPMDELEAVRLAQEEIKLAEMLGWKYCKLPPEALRALLARAQRPHD